jgi:hypothetical protein
MGRDPLQGLVLYSTLVGPERDRFGEGTGRKFTLETSGEDVKNTLETSGEV